ncbi:glycoside hydrolase family 31 [Apiospora arundinis]|uniref:Glycoside hydrolase family 31 n=1 Tax=Apiospora arundinis TaxID=335852 RepID=A0ABR2IA35_9PEZI
MASPDAPTGPLATTTDLFVSENAFKIVTWVGTGVCIIVCFLRLSVRLLTFRRLFAEDYLMLCSLAILAALAAVMQLTIDDIYLVLHVQNQQVMPGLDFPDRLTSGMRGHGAALLLNTTGIWAIKLSFLAFFRRFGAKVRSYMITWWVACALVVVCGAVYFAIFPYGCEFGSFVHLTTTCATRDNIASIYRGYKASIALDVISDAIIMCFPIFIAWRTKISMRQKVILTAVFLLVGFTIAVTIVRGSIFGGVYKSLEEADGQVINMAWVLFWFIIQYFVSFTIACLISFRSLWVNRREKESSQRYELEKRRRAAEENSAKASSKKRRNSPWSRLQDSVLQTLVDLEGRDLEDDSQLLLKHQPPSGKLAVDFSNWGRADNAWSVTSTCKGSSSQEETLRSSHSRNDSV